MFLYAYIIPNTFMRIVFWSYAFIYVIIPDINNRCRLVHIAFVCLYYGRYSVYPFEWRLIDANNMCINYLSTITRIIYVCNQSVIC